MGNVKVHTHHLQRLPILIALYPCCAVDKVNRLISPHGTKLNVKLTFTFKRFLQGFF